MSPPLDELYLTWLYEQVADSQEERKSRTYWGLLKQLYTKEFVWFIPNDDNRAADGRCLRDEFIEEIGLNGVDDDWMSLGCSMLELLLGLSRRLSFEAGGEPSAWFWRLIKNCRLHIHSDIMCFPSDDVDAILDGIIWRKYDYNGLGGLFPLTDAVEDQREKEIWYQLQAYLIENC